MTNGDAPAEVPRVWDSGALAAKAQRYIEAMLEISRDSWQFGLLSSLALELLARAALSKISPALLADPADWNNLYYALGHTPTTKKFAPKSIIVTEALRRLNEILPEFDSELEGFCKIHIGRRNAELHSADASFDGVRQSAWLPTYYRSCSVLLESIGSSLEEFLGDNEFVVAQKLIDAAADDTAKAVSGTIKSHQTVWSAKEEEERTQLARQASLWAIKHVGHRVQCPACGSIAIVTGEAISTPDMTLQDDVITERQQYLPSRFECIACGMKITGLSHLSAGGLGDAYTRTQMYDATEYYAPEDEMQEWEPDYNEPY